VKITLQQHQEFLLSVDLLKLREFQAFLRKISSGMLYTSFRHMRMDVITKVCLSMERSKAEDDSPSKMVLIMKDNSPRIR
jgi:predicted nucleotidyltransferase